MKNHLKSQFNTTPWTQAIPTLKFHMPAHRFKNSFRQFIDNWWVNFKHRTTARSNLAILSAFLDLLFWFSQCLYFFLDFNNHMNSPPDSLILTFDRNRFREACTCVSLGLCVPKILVWRILPEAAGGNWFLGGGN